ncbi:hypothetical protein HZA99_01810 [Candidatus Woesearchaeota archaeon]|nr:hypothetical protein [Candidatus Woesearchaeota archaeon]
MNNILNKSFPISLLQKKKAQIDTTWLFVFFRFIVVCLVALAMVILVKTYIVAKIDIQQTQADLFMYNLLNEKNGLSHYDDSINRVFVGTIPVADFKNPIALEERLNGHMDFGEHTLIAAQLILFDQSGKKLGTAYYNKEWYDRWIIVARTFWKGSGSASEFSENKTVLLLYPDKTTAPGILQFSVVMPNS